MWLQIRSTVVTVAILATVAVALPAAIRPPERSVSPSSDPSAGSVALTARAATPSLASATAQPVPSSVQAVAAPSIPMLEIAIVPIVGFWSTDRALSLGQLRATLTGGDRRFGSVVVGAPDLAGLAAALDVSPGSNVHELPPVAALAAVQGHSGVLGFIRATDVVPSVRALGVGDRTLFGNMRVRSIGAWPLTVEGPSDLPASGPAFDPARTWTLVAGGDVMNDREVYRRTVMLGRGPDFPWNGGTARITRRSCCTNGLTTVTARRTGNPGALAALFRDADLALVNHEGPAPDRSTYHATGLFFTFDQRLEAGLRHAGIDVVSLANNHIRNAGSSGVLQTIHAIRAAGMVPLGAGRTLDAARRPAWFTADGIRVAMLAYDAVDVALAGATRTRPGAARLMLPRVRADIRAARKAGAEVVIVVPHWGVEYTSRPTAVQRRQAAALVAAGADVILGSHPHWAGALESIGQGVVVYSMGDLIFDLPRSEQTDEGLIVELSFVGPRLAQIDLHPTIELDRSQPNLLDPVGDGRVVLDRVRRASRAHLRW